MAESELFERGLQARRDVLGAAYVDANLAGTDEFMMAFQHVVTEWAWGYAWSRPGLDRKTRSMLNLAILTALGRPDELGIYVKGALATGVSVDEIKEILIHATVYCGTPAGRSGWSWAQCSQRLYRGGKSLRTARATQIGRPLPGMPRGKSIPAERAEDADPHRGAGAAESDRVRDGASPLQCLLPDVHRSGARRRRLREV